MNYTQIDVGESVTVPGRAAVIKPVIREHEREHGKKFTIEDTADGVRITRREATGRPGAPSKYGFSEHLREPGDSMVIENVPAGMVRNAAWQYGDRYGAKISVTQMDDDRVMVRWVGDGDGTAPRRDKYGFSALQAIGDSVTISDEPAYRVRAAASQYGYRHGVKLKVTDNHDVLTVTRVQPSPVVNYRSEFVDFAVEQCKQIKGSKDAIKKAAHLAGVSVVIAPDADGWSVVRQDPFGISKMKPGEKMMLQKTGMEKIITRLAMENDVSVYFDDEGRKIAEKIGFI